MDRLVQFFGRDKKRSYQVIVATLPVTLYLSYSLYYRIVLQKDPTIITFQQKPNTSIEEEKKERNA